MNLFLHSPENTQMCDILLRDHAKNTTNPAISLAAYNVIILVIGPPAQAPSNPAVLVPCHGERT